MHKFLRVLSKKRKYFHYNYEAIKKKNNNTTFEISDRNSKINQAVKDLHGFCFKAENEHVNLINSPSLPHKILSFDIIKLPKFKKHYEMHLIKSNLPALRLLTDESYKKL